jgi:hypothetical protein
MGLLRSIVAIIVITIALVLGSGTPVGCDTPSIEQAPDGVSILI